MPYFPVDDGFSSHPKVTRLRRGPTRERAIGLWTLAGAWCAFNLTDGQVPPDQVAELGCTRTAAQWLVDVRLWHAAGHDCSACPQPEPGGWVFHEWAVQGRNFTRDAVLQRRAAKAAAGSKGGVRSGQTRRAAARQTATNNEASASQLVEAPASQFVEPPSHPIPKSFSYPASPEPHQPRIGLAKSDDEHEPHPGGRALDRHGHPRHDHEPNARSALTAIRRERRLGVEVALLLSEAYRIGHGDPWRGYLAINAETEIGIDRAWTRSGATLDRVRRLGPQRIEAVPDWLREDPA
jgi:hypothetical protein